VRKLVERRALRQLRAKLLHNFFISAKMKFTVVGSLTILLLLAGFRSATPQPSFQVKSTSWKKCAEGDFEINDATLEPEIISPGTTARFTIHAVAGQTEVDSGSIEMLVRLAGVPIYAQQDSLCSKTTCPIGKGSEAKIVYEQDFPEYTPPAGYSLTLSGRQSTGAVLFCIEIQFEVSPFSTDNFVPETITAVS